MLWMGMLTLHAASLSWPLHCRLPRLVGSFGGLAPSSG